MKGVVTRVFADKGYLFVRDTEGVSRFVHASWTNGMFDALIQGTQVEFEPSVGPKGPQAKDLKILVAARL